MKIAKGLLKTGNLHQPKEYVSANGYLLSQSSGKMEKTPRYTQRERNMVLGFAAQYRDVIENKKTDAESNRRKDEIWRIIAKDFNARVYHQRTSKQLRQLYKNMKLLLKKDLCSEGGLSSMPILAGKKPKSFMDILTAFSQASSVSQLLASPPSNGTNSDGGSSGGQYNGIKIMKGGDFDDTKVSHFACLSFFSEIWRRGGKGFSLRLVMK